MRVCAITLTIPLTRRVTAGYRHLPHLTGLPMKKNTTSRRSQDSRNLSVAIFNQLHPRLMIKLHQKMTGLQHIAVADEAPVAIEEAGGVDIAENEDGAPTEIVVAGVVSGLSEYSLIRRLTYDPDSAYRGRGDGEFRGRGEGNERELCISSLILSSSRSPCSRRWRMEKSRRR